MSRGCWSLLLGVFLMSALAGAPVRAYDLPSVNLGFTSFLDGAPPSGPGLYLQQYLQYYGADKFAGADGRDLPLPADVDLEAWVSLTQMVYQSEQEFAFGGRWGLNVILPYVGLDLQPGTLPLRDNGSGFGDLLVGPFLQWDPVMGEGGPRFVHRLELQMIFPTGKYDDDRQLNPGSNFFSFNPYWAATLFLSPRWTTSWRLHYLWNAPNDDPAMPVDEVRAGQALHANFTSAYEVLPKRLRLGLNGYFLKQVSDSEIDGSDVSGSRERVLALGPGAVWHISPDTHLFCNLYFESEAENRPEGERFNLRIVHHF